MLMPGRTYSAQTGYRYGFNGKENDNEIKGEGNQQDYGMRIYDPRLGKFLSVDPLTKSYPMLTPYAFAENDVIRSIDLDGLEKYIVNNKYRNGHLREVWLQATYDKKTKDYVNMQFKYANGNRVTLQDVMIINQFYNKDGELIKDNIIFSNVLTEGQKKLLKSTPKESISNTLFIDYSIKNHPEIQESSFPVDGLSELQGVQRIPLIKNHDLNQSLDHASSFFWVDRIGNAQMLSRSEASVASGGSQDLLKLYDLPATIKEDGGIKSINITLNIAFSNDLNDKEFASIQQGLNKISDQLKAMYQRNSGVKNVNVHFNSQRTKDFEKINAKTPDVQINLKR
jgi:RHS repeat-associated protein